MTDDRRKGVSWAKRIDRLADAAASGFIRLRGIDPDGPRALEVATVARSLAVLIRRPFERLFASRDARKTSDAVERKYDALAGSYIARRYGELGRGERWYYLGQDLQRRSNRDYVMQQQTRYCDVLAQFPFRRILEVGAGELTTLAAVAERFGPEVHYVAAELSLNRVQQGRRLFIQRIGAGLDACKANAVRLPFPDASVDVAFTSQALEHMPYDFRAAVSEMCRVARRAVVLFEPSYEMGSTAQRLRMLAKDYFRGLPAWIATLKGVRCHAPFWVGGSPVNRIACTVIEIDGRADGELPPFQYVCPVTHEPVERIENYWMTPGREALYFEFRGVPVLDAKHRFDIAEHFAPGATPG